MSGRTYEQAVPVHFGEVDYARVLYYPRLLHKCHVVMEGFFERVVGLPYPRLLAERRRGFPTVHLEADYCRPMPYGITLDFSLSVRRLGRSSLHLRYRASAAGVLHAEARITAVCVDMDRFEKVAIPDDLRAAFEPYLEEGG